MANPIFFLGRSKVLPTSRYAGSRAIYYSEQMKQTFETYKRKYRNLAAGANEKWVEIPYEYEYRPDLLSYYVYGTVDFWWRIMEYNGMKDILEFKAGVNVRLPNNVFL